MLLRPKTESNLFLIFALSSAIYFTQGLENLPSQGLFYYLKESLNFSPQKIMCISSIITTAWLVKPVIGYIIDNFLNKRAWIFIALIFSSALSVIIGSTKLSIAMLVGMLVLGSAWSAFRDVAVDGIMCVEGKKYNATGRIQSVQWISIAIATLLTGICGGYIAEKWDYRLGFLLLIPMYLVAGGFAFFYKENGYIKTETAAKFIQDMKAIFTNRKLLFAGLFVFLYRFSPSFGTPLFFIQRDRFMWSKVWIGSLTSISTIFSIIGALIYYKFSRTINVKKWLFVSVFLGALTTLSYLYYTPVTAVVYDISYSLFGMFIFLMILDFMAKNSMPGLEAASFALLTSLSNLALVASNLSGAFLLPVLGLQWLIAISAATSFLCLIFINKITV